MKLILDGKPLTLAATDAIAEGGEATIYDLHDGRVLKLWKGPDHPDVAHDAGLRQLATARITNYSRKLMALPADVAQRAPQLVLPSAFCRNADDQRIVGFAMRKLDGSLLHSFGEPRSWQAGFAGKDRVAMLQSLHQAVTHAHQAGFVIGDFNDLNVLFEGTTAYLIDVDSFQFGSWPASMFTERFADPRLLRRTPQGLALAQPHDARSDWFAFCCMVVRTLLGTSPWGGVPTKACTPSERLLQRISIFSAGITYPRAARPIATLPSAVEAHLQAVFAGTVPASFPRVLLDAIDYSACQSCGMVHARERCTCGAATPRLAAVSTADVTVTTIDRHSVQPNVSTVTAWPTATCPVWLRNQAVWRQRGLREERIVSLVSGQTRVWATPTLGTGFYRVGAFTVGFMFRTASGLAREFTGLPALRGFVVDACASIADSFAWLTITTAEAGSLRTHLILLSESDGLIACADVTTQPWATGLAGAHAAQQSLYVPTDHGVVRLGARQQQFAIERAFPQTAPWVHVGCQLGFDQRGLLSRSDQGAVALVLR
jgi:hypothetical protein